MRIAKRFASFLVLVSFGVFGCSAPSNDHCHCPAPVTDILTFVDDATGSPVTAAPSDPHGPFSVDGRWVEWECDPTSDAAAPCSAWDMDGIFGPATIHVDFEGYEPADVSSNVTRGNDCCGLAEDPLVTTVRLKKR